MLDFQPKRGGRARLCLYLIICSFNVRFFCLFVCLFFRLFSPSLSFSCVYKLPAFFLFSFPHADRMGGGGGGGEGGAGLRRKNIFRVRRSFCHKAL